MDDIRGISQFKNELVTYTTSLSKLLRYNILFVCRFLQEDATHELSSYLSLRTVQRNTENLRSLELLLRCLFVYFNIRVN